MQCDALARRYQLVQARGTAVWPDGTVTARYGFRHALYQELLYERIPVSRRARWHLQIGMRFEEAFGPRAGEVAGRGRDAGYPAPPAQIPACGTTAPGSCLGSTNRHPKMPAVRG